jgi:DNA-binding NarL/FixJ family response regulator
MARPSGDVMKILVVDDHPLFRAGLHAVLAQSGLATETLSVASLQEALTLLTRDTDIGLVLLDVHLREEDGFAALRVIGERFPTTACVMISGDETEGVVSRAIAHGASGFIPKSLTADQTIAAIRRVLAGEVFVPANAPEATGEPGALTLRQLEVIDMLGRGLTNKEIARAMNLAERTVKAHITGVFEALKVRNRTEAVLAAQRLGFLLVSPHGAAR